MTKRELTPNQIAALMMRWARSQNFSVHEAAVGFTDALAAIAVENADRDKAKLTFLRDAWVAAYDEAVEINWKLREAYEDAADDLIEAAKATKQ